MMARKDAGANRKGRGATAHLGAPRRTEAKADKATATRTVSPSWKLEDAKAKFSEVVRRAHAEGPQYVTVRGKPSVAVIDAAELERLLPSHKPRLPLVPFMESLYVEGLDLERDADRGRDVEL
jgi:antitoxin Phd